MASDTQVTLDRTRFDRTMTVPYVSLEKKYLDRFMFHLRPFLLKVINIKPVEDDVESSERKQVLLDPEKIKELQDLGQDFLQRMETNMIDVQFEKKDIQLNYNNLPAETVLKELLPHSLSGWSIIGHIIHLNLKEFHMPYKYLIGQVLLDKFPNIKLVVNKTTGIENEFRNFPMEIIAKKSDDVSTQVEVKHSNCTFKFDFAKVYWNPRLDTEHQRILDKLRPGMDVLYDVFAGVGPFSIPAAKKKCKAVANDLNPESFKWIQENARINRVTALHQSFNMDGRDFIRDVVKKDILEEWSRFSSGEEPKVKKFHIVMNLPAIAIEFLDSFVGWLSSEEETVRSLEGFSLPSVHCYCFVRGEGREENRKTAVKMVEQVIQAEISNDIQEVLFVRKVAPTKDMFRVSFTTPEQVVFANKSKKRKVDMKDES